MSFSNVFPDFVGPSSPILFQRLKINNDFLEKPAAEWVNDSVYLAGKAKAWQFLVVNDLAEIGVKLTSDYLITAKLEDHFQNNLQAVEASWKNHPQLRGKKSVISGPFNMLPDNA